MITYRLFDVPGGHGYEILRGDQVVMHQDFDPDEPGFIAMNEATARTKAEAVVARIIAADPAE